MDLSCRFIDALGLSNLSAQSKIVHFEMKFNGNEVQMTEWINL